MARAEPRAFRVGLFIAKRAGRNMVVAVWRPDIGGGMDAAAPEVLASRASRRP